MITRRSLLAALPLLAQTKRPIGLALYTVRNVVLQQPRQVLREAASIGFIEVEIMRSQVEPLSPHLKDAGLRAVSLHFETPLITGNWQAWRDAEMPPVDDRLTFERTLDDARRAGITNLVFNYLPPKERGDLDYYRGLSDKLNAAAEKCRAAGGRLWYHNHNFEFAQKSGGRPIDVLLERLDPKLISLEVDAFWVSMAGVDPASFIRQHASRVVAVHLKDRARGAVVPKFDIASVPNSTYQEVGAGDLDFASLLRATANVKHLFVEQDHTSDPMGSIRRSYAALRKLGF